MSPDDCWEKLDGTEWALLSPEMVDTALISHGESPSVVPPL